MSCDNPVDSPSKDFFQRAPPLPSCSGQTLGIILAPFLLHLTCPPRKAVCSLTMSSSCRSQVPTASLDQTVDAASPVGSQLEPLAPPDLSLTAARGSF